MMTIDRPGTAGVQSAQHPTIGWIFVAWDTATHHIEGAVQQSRFAARLSPYRTQEAALGALEKAGAIGAR